MSAMGIVVLADFVLAGCVGALSLQSGSQLSAVRT